MFVGDDRDYREVQRLKQAGTYGFATCYDIEGWKNKPIVLVYPNSD